MRLLHHPAALSLGIALAAAAALPGTAPARTVGRRAVAPRAATATAQRPASVFQVNTGRGRLVTLAQPMTDLFVANPAVADVQVRSATQLYIFGKATGETTVSATGKSGQVVYATTVRVANNMDSVQSMLGLALPDAHLVATPMNGLVLLTGTVASPADAAEAERLVQAFVGTDTKVLSRLKSATPLQVMLQVRIAEVSHNFAKNFSSNIGTVDKTGGVTVGIARGNTNRPQFSPYLKAPLATGFNTTPTGVTVVDQIANGTTAALAGRLLGVNLLTSLDIGETLGQVATLANPNLTALSGETATFLVGGEIPIPVSQGLGAVSVEYKQYGISLAFTPTVLADGRISMRVRPEVSQLSSAGQVTINGTTIPALSTRRVETSAELGSGQSMMIGGLLQNTHNNSIEKTPGLGDVPILGALFRSNGWQRNETELVIVITPYLVKPVNNPADIVLPTDGEKGPTDLQRIFLGKLGDGTSGEKRPGPTMAPLPAPVTPPAAGAAAPVPPAPVTAPAADPRATRKQRGTADVAPGFSN